MPSLTPGLDEASARTRRRAEAGDELCGRRVEAAEVAVRAGNEHGALEGTEDHARRLGGGALEPQLPSQVSFSSKKPSTASRIVSGRVPNSAASMPQRHRRSSRRTSAYSFT
jgi:hypothetical protein